MLANWNSSSDFSLPWPHGEEPVSGREMITFAIILQFGRHYIQNDEDARLKSMAVSFLFPRPSFAFNVGTTENGERWSRRRQERRGIRRNMQYSIL